MSNVEGFFEVVAKTMMGMQPGNFDYHVNGTELTGTATAMGATVDIFDGVVDGNHYSHQMEMVTPMGSMKIKVNGEVNGDEITGEMKAGLLSMKFTGKRS